MATEQNIEGYFSGDHANLNFTLTDDNDTALDLTGALAIEWQLAQRVSSSSALITKTLGSGITITNASGGLITVALIPADTASLKSPDGSPYYHECQVTDASGNVSTVTYGTFEIRQDKIS